MNAFSNLSEAFKRGYDWAYSELNKGTSIPYIKSKIDGAFDYTDFDRGAAEAIHDYVISHDMIDSFGW